MAFAKPNLSQIYIYIFISNKVFIKRNMTKGNPYNFQSKYLVPGWNNPQQNYMNISNFTSILYSRCQWNKVWYPFFQALPECKITDCINPFPIPDDAQLEVL